MKLLTLIFFIIFTINCSLIRKSEYTQYLGIYEYVHDQESNEVSKIKLETKDGLIVGTYYGISDDFDPAREGYLPGYFFTEMKNLSIKNGNISYLIHVYENEIYDKIIPISYKLNDKLPISYKKWIEGSGSNKLIILHYEGRIIENKINLKITGGETGIQDELIFVKIHSKS